VTEQDARRGRPTARHLLLDAGPLRSSPAFRRIWLGGACSSLGSQMTLVAVLFQVWQTTHSATWTGAVGLAQAVPLIVFGLFAGAWADRGDRRRFYLAAVAGLTGCAALLTVQGFLGGAGVLPLLGLVAVQSCFGTAAGPAGRTFIAHLLPGTQQAAGLALNRIAGQATMLLGPALGGLVVGGAGVGGCYLIDTATFLVALRAAYALPAMPPGGGPPRPGMQGVAEGLRFLAGNPAVRGALLVDLVTTVLSMPMALFPLLNAERFGGDPRTLGLFLTAVGAGGVAASVFSGSFTRSSRPGLVMVVGSLGWSTALALLGVAPNAGVALALLAVAGAADTVAVVSRSTVVQVGTPKELLGRVTAAEQIAGSAGPQLGSLRAGIVADLTSARFALVSGGLLGVAAVALIAVTQSGRRRRAAGSGSAALTGSERRRNVPDRKV
jgi:MFS family permease